MQVIDLKGRVCLVTGGNRGIGLATAEKFAAAGAEVIIAARDQVVLESAAKEINNAGQHSRVVAITCDVSNEDSVKQLFKAIHQKYKRLDVLVANAGILDDALVGMMTKNQVEKTFAVNTFGVLFCCQYAARLMARNSSGSMILMSSIIGRVGNAGQAVYAGSKAAVLGIASSLAKELAPQGIRVNAIAPGFIDTEMARSIPPEKFQERLNSIAMRKIGTPADVAQTALFLASDLSTYVTGQVIGVDGGMLI